MNSRCQRRENELSEVSCHTDAEVEWNNRRHSIRTTVRNPSRNRTAPAKRPINSEHSARRQVPNPRIIERVRRPKNLFMKLEGAKHRQRSTGRRYYSSDCLLTQRQSVCEEPSNARISGGLEGHRGIRRLTGSHVVRRSSQLQRYRFQVEAKGERHYPKIKTARALVRER